MSLFMRFLMCYIYNGQSELQQIPKAKPIFLKKNTGRFKRQLMTLKCVMGLALF